MYAIGAASPTRILVRNILVYPPALSLLHLHHDFYISGNNVIRCNSYAAKKQYNS